MTTTYTHTYNRAFSSSRQVLREAVAMGMPRTRRPWKKILVVVEGIYSMEGEVADLAPIVKVAKKHKVGQRMNYVTA